MAFRFIQATKVTEQRSRDQTNGDIDWVIRSHHGDIRRVMSPHRHTDVKRDVNGTGRHQHDTMRLTPKHGAMKSGVTAMAIDWPYLRLHFLFFLVVFFDRRSPAERRQAIGTPTLLAIGHLAGRAGTLCVSISIDANCHFLNVLWQREKKHSTKSQNVKRGFP